MALGLRYCPNHTIPLILKYRGGNLLWMCEHESRCAYYETAIARNQGLNLAASGESAGSVHNVRRRGSKRGQR